MKMICSDMNQGIILWKRYYNSETNLSKIQIIFSGQVVIKEPKKNSLLPNLLKNKDEIVKRYKVRGEQVKLLMKKDHRFIFRLASNCKKTTL